MNGKTGYFNAQSTSDKINFAYDSTFPAYFGIDFFIPWRDTTFTWSGVRILDFDADKDIGSSGTKTLSSFSLYRLKMLNGTIAAIAKLS